MKAYDIAIIGAGASGLAAAIEAKRTAPQKTVAVFEHLPRVGKKILATGNGRCNLGNLTADTHAYTNRSFAQHGLTEYNAESLIDFFESMGLFTRADSEGRLYPLSNTAASVLDALRFECERLGVQFFCDYKVSSIKKDNHIFSINGEYNAKKVIVACGGKSSPAQGSDGSGYPLLKALGHNITPLAPALVQLVTDTAKIKALKGVRASARLTLSTGGETKGEILFTDYGISGIAAMDLSRYISPDKKAFVTIDLLPDFDVKKAKSAVFAAVTHNPDQPCEYLLGGLVPKALGTAVIKATLGFLPKSAKEINEDGAKKIALELKGFTLTLKGTKSFNDAQITRGGADVRQFDRRTMMSKKVDGLYACGEILDIDGACGGFNLAWAFASGRLAGKNAATA